MNAIIRLPLVFLLAGPLLVAGHVLAFGLYGGKYEHVFFSDLYKFVVGGWTADMPDLFSLFEEGIDFDILMEAMSSLSSVDVSPGSLLKGSRVVLGIQMVLSFLRSALAAGNFGVGVVTTSKLVPTESFSTSSARQASVPLATAPKELRRDRAFVLAAVQKEGFVLEYADAELLKDREIVLAAIGTGGEAFYRILNFMDRELWKDREFVVAAVQISCQALCFADAEFHQDRELVLAAVRFSGLALKIAHPDLCADREIVLAAVQQNGGALYFADAKLQKDRELVLAALQQDPTVLECADAELRNDPDFMRAVANQRSIGVPSVLSAIQLGVPSSTEYN